jgi:hypothetical protein
MITIFKWKSWREGDACPDCSKGKLVAVNARSVLTLGRLVPYLLCDGYPRCGFATRRIASGPETKKGPAGFPAGPLTTNMANPSTGMADL